jgi:hypothetical protein
MLQRRDSGCGCESCAIEASEELLTGPVSYNRGKSDDIEIVQTLLNNIAPLQGGPALQLTVDGIFGLKTNAAVTHFQQKWLGWNDGRVDSAGPTLSKMKDLVSASPSAQKGTIGNIGKGKKKVQTKGPSLFDLQIYDFYVDAAKSAVARIREKIGILHWKISRRDKTTIALMRKHFLKSNETLSEHDINHVLAIVSRTHSHMARANVFGRFNYENHIMYDFDPDPGTAIAWTSYGGDKLSINQSQIYFEKKKNKLIKAPGSTIFITNIFLDYNQSEQSWIMLHEYCHLVGDLTASPNRINDNGYAFEGNFVSMPKFLKLHNAESISFFMTEFCFGTKDAVALPRVASYADWFNSAPIVNPGGELSS